MGTKVRAGRVVSETRTRTIHVYYDWEGERHHRAFPDKKRAYRWFYYLCPAETGECVQEENGVLSAPKRLRKRPRRTMMSQG